MSRSRLAICVLCLVADAAWLFVLVGNPFGLAIPTSNVVYVGLALIPLTCIAANMWRELLGVVCGGFLGFFIFATKVNGSGLEDVRSMIGGAVAGMLAGSIWHGSRTAVSPGNSQPRLD